MRYSTRRLSPLTAILVSLVLLMAACNGDSDTDDTDDDNGGSAQSTDDTVGVGEVFISGSSTVEPISSLVADMLSDVNSDIEVTVDGPGTGDGFKLFCEGEADISDASRQIKASEKEACLENGINNIIELKVGIDGIAVMTGSDNTAVDCLTFEHLFDLIGPNGQGTKTWVEASSDLPDETLTIFGPGEESGTFDSFVEIVLEGLAEEAGVETTTRTDYNPSENDNVILRGIQSSTTSLGWLGFAFAVNAQDVKLLSIDGGEGCIAPTPETIASNEYPISRDLWIYVNADKAAANPAVAAYVDFYTTEGLAEATSEVGYVELTPEDQAQTQSRWQNRTTIG
ncbi:MAG: substrate-binding domain-containing protein [Acidimicrobiaceae bacterium]|nr:substrate-binding domain-containing protein [Acidimicrobiaceae bacterium]